MPGPGAITETRNRKAHRAAHELRPALTRSRDCRGIRFYAYERGFLHEKVMLIDDEFSTVGTANYDNRSFRLNFEVTSLIVDREFAGEMEAMFEDDFAHSVELDPNTFSEKPIWWRLGVALSRLAAPVL